MNKLKSIIALTVVVFIPFGIMIWIRMHQSSGFASIELIAYPLIFGGASILAIYLLKKYYLKESLQDFNSGSGSRLSDSIWGVILTLIYFLLFFIERATLSNLLNHIPNMEMLELMLSMREQPILLLIWFGPVLWIGIAFYEELLRVFLLTSLWKWSHHILWTFSIILIAAIVIGLAHWSQGSYGIVTITIKSLVSGYFFYKKRRLMPLIYAHVFYDGLQVAMLLLTYPG